MKYELDRILKEVEQDERRRKPDPKQKLTREQIRERVKQRKQEKEQK